MSDCFESDTPNRQVLVDRRSAVAFALLLPYFARAQESRPALDVHYVPTPMPVVNRMLELAAPKRDDMLYDLGCGDGRIVVTAAKRFGTRGVGIDLDPVRIEEARTNAKTEGVEDRVEFRQANLFEADLSKANVVTLYLLNSLNQRLRLQLWRQLRVGSRVVSHAFSMGEEWPPERQERIAGATVYKWTITKANKAAA